MSNKKLIIGFSIVTSVLLAVIVSLSIVLASFSTKTNSPFRVTYTAGANVAAEVELAWAIVDEANIASTQADAFTSAGVKEFNTTDTEETVVKDFDELVKSIGKDTALIMRYSLKNKDTANALSLTAEAKNITTNNMSIGYTKDLTQGLKAGFSDVVSTTGETIAANGAYVVYVVVQIILDTQNASASGTYTFNLAA